MQSIFQEYKSQNQNKTFVYTDGSKQGVKVGFGMAAALLDYGKRLPDKLSMFTAESALLAAVEICVLQKRNNVVICSVSKSVLQALRNVYNPTHHIIAQINKKKIPDDQNISFLWIPGHARIPGNEKADEIAKLALSEPEPKENFR